MFTPSKFNRILTVVVTLTLLFSAVQPSAVSAQSGDGIRRQINPQSGRVSFIGPESGRALSAYRALGTFARPQDPARALANRFAPEFGLKNPARDLSEMKAVRPENGRLTVHYQQKYNGIPVMGGELIVNTNERGDLYSMNGEVSPNLSLQTAPTIDSAQAAETALQALAKWYQRSPEEFSISTPELWIYDESLLRPSARPAELVWRMEVTAKNKAIPVRELVLVNAERGGISLHFNQIDTAWTGRENSNSAAAFDETFFAVPSPSSGAADILQSVVKPKPAFAGTTWYVATTGNDMNSCSSPAAPCATINGAIGKAASGDTILVAEGIYKKITQDFYSTVVSINKNVTIIGGWNSAFETNTSYSIIDGEGKYGVSNSTAYATLSRFIIQNASGVGNVDGTLILRQVAVIKNKHGVNNMDGTLIIENTTISQNSGIGLNTANGTVNIINSTIANNIETHPGTFGGGIRTVGGTITITNSIIAYNKAAQSPDCYAYPSNSFIISHGYNIIGTTSGCAITATTGDKFNVDPLLSSLLPVGYQPLSQNSPAINAGNPLTCTQKDQRDVLRLSDGKCDIGAYEYKPAGSAVKLVGVNTEIQRTPINSPFKNRLLVAALDQYGSPVGGVTIHFSAPNTGPTGIFANGETTSTTVTDTISGIGASLVVTANEQYGDYSITASAVGISGVVAFYLHNGAWLVSASIGNDTNDCLSTGSPCASIQGVLSKPEFNSGEVIWVAGGTYANAVNYYISKDVTIVGSWNSSFSGRGSSTILQESYNPASQNIVIRQVVFQGPYAGVVNDYNLIIENSSVYQTDIGISNSSNGNLTLQNVTISGNNGTAILNTGGNIYITNSTISQNRGVFIGGIENSSGTVTLKNTILAGNIALSPQTFASADCMGEFVSLGNNIIGTIGSYDNIIKNYDCRSNWAVTDIVGDDTAPVPLDRILSPTVVQDPASGQWIYPLKLGSLALNAILLNNCPSTDQRGVSRPQGGSCDIGAYEYVFNSDSNNLLITTYNAGNTTTLPGTFVCDQTDLNCLAGDTHAKGAHKYAAGTYNLYKTSHNRNSIDGNGIEIISTVHYGNNYGNAFWNGYMMIYGDAYGFALADDIVAHELTHGVTQYESNLFYYYQSGAISESFSDLWGEYYDQTNGQGNDDVTVRWLLGEDITGLGAVRSMNNPLLFNDPDRMSSPNYYEGEDDNGGVHTNSGVNNKAVSLMVDGGAFNGRTVTALGWDKTAAIYYEANTNLLSSGADYSDLYYALQQACSNLIGTKGITSADCVEVKDALDAVEMNAQPAPNFNTDAPLCTTPGTYPSFFFTDDLESGASNWTFNNGSSVRWQWDSPYGPFAQSGLHSLYADDYPEAITDATARLTSFIVPANAFLHFAHAYDFETTSVYWDGGVLEYSINNGSTWVDAGSLMTHNGYRGTIYANWNNPLKGRAAFVGTSHGYISTRVNLASLAGKTVTFRWRMGLDDAGAAWGWWVDNIRVYTCVSAFTLSGNAGASGVTLSYTDGTPKTVTSQSNGDYS
ncbi:MAG: M4 family metallopeptidase, partial [Chloroflexota bacterium]